MFINIKQDDGVYMIRYENHTVEDIKKIVMIKSSSSKKTPSNLEEDNFDLVHIDSKGNRTPILDDSILESCLRGREKDPGSNSLIEVIRKEHNTSVSIPKLPVFSSMFNTGAPAEGRTGVNNEDIESKDKGLEQAETEGTITFRTLPAGDTEKVSSEGGAEHKLVQCDECFVSPIIGKRFKSVNLIDFDLCSKCVELPKYKKLIFLMMQEDCSTVWSIHKDNFNVVLDHFNKGPFEGCRQIERDGYRRFSPIDPNATLAPGNFRTSLTKQNPPEHSSTFNAIKQMYPLDIDTQIEQFLVDGKYTDTKRAYIDYSLKYHPSSSSKYS